MRRRIKGESAINQIEHKHNRSKNTPSSIRTHSKYGLKKIDLSFIFVYLLSLFLFLLLKFFLLLR